MTEKFLTLFTYKPIVILILHVTDELIIVQLSTFSHRLNVLQRDFALEIMIFNIRKVMCSQKKISCLFYVEAVEFDNLHREHNMFIFLKLILDFNILLKVEVIVP